MSNHIYPQHYTYEITNKKSGIRYIGVRSCNCNPSDDSYMGTSKKLDEAIEIEGKEIKEVLKKGCPFNVNLLNKNNSINSTYNGIALTVDMIDENPNRVRLFALRSFGESLHHSITDASLEFGYKAI